MKKIIFLILIVAVSILALATVSALVMRLKNSNMYAGGNPADSTGSGGSFEPDSRKKTLFQFKSTAGKVGIAGDFTGWKEKIMKKQNRNSWYVVMELKPGLYGYNFIEYGKAVLDPENMQKGRNPEGVKCSLINIK